MHQVTTICASQSGTSAERASRSCERHIREPSGVKLGGLGLRRELPQQGPGRSLGRQRFLRILSGKNR